jgi:predicted CXXCH cytochrome family protein
MNKLATAFAALALVAAVLAPRSVWSRTDGKICELTHVEREKVDSARCVSCHDGSVAPAVHTNLRSPLGGSLGGLSGRNDGSHPVDVDYDRAQFNQPDRLTPSVMLNPALKLSSGKVTCATCHDGKSVNPFHTAVRMDGSALCYACHSGY